MRSHYSVRRADCVKFRKGCHGCGTPSRKRVGLAALGVRLPPLPLWRHGREAEGGALLVRRRLGHVRRFESCCLRSFRCGRVAEAALVDAVKRWWLLCRRHRLLLRAAVNREAQVRVLPPELCFAPVVEGR